MRDMPTHIREKVADHDKTEEREREKKTKKEGGKEACSVIGSIARSVRKVLVNSESYYNQICAREALMGDRQTEGPRMRSYK